MTDSGIFHKAVVPALLLLGLATGSIGQAAAATANAEEAGRADLVASRIEVVQDERSRQKKVRAPMVYLDGFAVGRSYMLRSTLDPGDPVDAPSLLQLYVTAQFNDWAYLGEGVAEDRRARRRLVLTPIDRNHFGCHQRGAERRCNLTETVAIELSVADLHEYASSGLRFSVEGRSGATEMEVPAAYFAAFAERLAAELTPATPSAAH